MSRAFVKEDDAPVEPVLPDRQISPHRNLVTRRGLQLIEQEIERYQRELGKAGAATDADSAGKASRELRYWAARHATAELSEPDPGADTVVFGTAVTLLREDDTELTLRIVGEDEADPAAGRIPWVAPVAHTLLGGEVGDVRELPTGRVEILAIDPTPEPANGPGDKEEA